MRRGIEPAPRLTLTARFCFYWCFLLPVGVIALFWVADAIWRLFNH